MSLEFEDDGVPEWKRRMLWLDQMAEAQNAQRIVVINGRYPLEPTEPPFIYKLVLRILAVTASVFVGLIIISIAVTLFERVTG